MTLSAKRFSVALSFPGEKRDFVEGVAASLAETLGKDRVLYDRFLEAELARPDLDLYLASLYRNQADLLVPFFCSDYNQKRWCGLEWRQMRDIGFNLGALSIMPLRFDGAPIAGVLSIDGYVEIGDRTSTDVAALILQRLASIENESSAIEDAGEPYPGLSDRRYTAMAIATAARVPTEAWNVDVLEDHLASAGGWASVVQNYGMAAPTDAAAQTIALTIAQEPRRFRPAGKNSATLTEDDLRTRRGHFVLTGDPGGGKTTTIKRMYCRLLKDRGEKGAVYRRYPICLQLRHLATTGDLWAHIADFVGLSFRRSAEVGNYVGGSSLENILIRLIDQSEAVVLLDGLDEVDDNRRIEVEQAVQRLMFGLKMAKVVISVRSGELSRSFENASIVELAPLSDPEIARLQARWFGKSAEFVEALANSAYGDLGRRPLTLMHLIEIFRREGRLPAQSFEVHEKIIRLLLDAWDRQRGIVRRSRYAGFGAEAKLRFLSALAMRLSYGERATVFDRRRLLRIFAEIHGRFGLPLNEAELVMDELEGHTGLLVKSDVDTFEFAHSSLQEYLCAHYLVGEAYVKQIEYCAGLQGAPLAIATAMAQSPAEFFAGLVLNPDVFKSLQVEGYLTRLRIEQPYIERHHPLAGIAILQLVSESDLPEEKDVIELLSRCFSGDVLWSCVSAAFTYYCGRIIDGSASKMMLRRTLQPTAVSVLVIPADLIIPVSFIVEATERFGRALEMQR